MAEMSRELAAALDELRFDEARRLIESLPEDERDEALAVVRVAEEDAVEDGEALANRIQLLARDDHYAALYALSSDEMTTRKLSLVSDEIRRGAEIHLNGARRRREQSLRSARRQIVRARESLDAFHTGDARKALSRVDETWLEEDDKAELEVLRLRYEKVKAEADELNSVGEKVLAEHGVRRRAGRAARGCLPGVLALLVLAAAAGLGLG